MLPPVFQNSYSKAPHSMLGISHFGSPTTLTKPQSTCEHWPGSQMYVEAQTNFSISRSGVWKKEGLIEIDGHPYFLMASSSKCFGNAFCLLFCCVPQAQLRGKGHEKRNWKWIFWQSYFFYLACEKQKTKKKWTCVFDFLYW